jgi:hypothetical protein
MAAMLWAGIASETIAFVPTTDGVVQVSSISNGTEEFVGSADKNNPLRKRFFTGQRRFRFASEGYQPLDTDVPVAISWLSSRERRIPITVRPAADFVVRGLDVVRKQQSSDERVSLPGRSHDSTPRTATDQDRSSATISMDKVHLEDRDGPRPPELSYSTPVNSAESTLFFTLASSSPSPLWVQGLYLRVFEVTPFKQSTFPYYGEGAPGPEPIQGVVILKPKLGSYKIDLPRKSKLGRGIEPDDFRVRVVCENGYVYRARLEVHWTDMNEQHRDGRLVVDPEIRLEFPELVRWEDLARQSGTVKILFYHYVSNLIQTLQLMKPPPDFAILIASSRAHEIRSELDKITKRTVGSMARKSLRIGVLPRSDQEIMIRLVGGLGYRNRPRNFLLLDDRTLLLQDGNRLDRAEIINDSVRVGHVQKMFDSVFAHLSWWSDQ